jgi:hypothetical protein
MAFLAGLGLCAGSLWLISASLFGGPERLLSLSTHDRELLAEHDRQIETVKNSDRNYPQYEGKSIRLWQLEAERPDVKLLWEEKVSRARETDRRNGYEGLVIGLGLLVWSIRRWDRVPPGAGAGKSGGPGEIARPRGTPKRRAATA